MDWIPEDVDRWVSEDEKVILIHADCSHVLARLPMVDAVITDPPYGINFDRADWDDSPNGYGEWLWAILERAERACNPGSPIFVFQASPNIRRFVEWFPREWRIYVAAKNFVQMRPTAMQYAYDPVICWWTNGVAYTAGTANRDYYIANTAGVISNPENIQRKHPTPKAVDQMVRMVDQWVRPGGIVLDLFMGSGTTGVACVHTGRQFIGVEIDRGYYDLARRRICKELERPKLFYGMPEESPCNEAEKRDTLDLREEKP